MCKPGNGQQLLQLSMCNGDAPEPETMLPLSLLTSAFLLSTSCKSCTSIAETQGSPPPVLVHPNLDHAPQSALRIPTCPEHPNLPLPLAQPLLPSPPPPWQSSALLSSLQAEHLIDRIIPYLLISSLVLSGQEWGRLCFPFIPKLSVFAGCRGSVSNLL